MLWLCLVSGSTAEENSCRCHTELCRIRYRVYEVAQAAGYKHIQAQLTPNLSNCKSVSKILPFDIKWPKKKKILTNKMTSGETINSNWHISTFPTGLSCAALHFNTHLHSLSCVTAAVPVCDRAPSFWSGRSSAGVKLHWFGVCRWAARGSGTILVWEHVSRLQTQNTQRWSSQQL